MDKPKQHSWIVVHIIYPLTPFVLDGVIRFITSDFIFSLKTFNTATLAMSVALLSILVNQSLLGTNPILASDDEQEEIAGTARQFLIYAIFGFALFSCLVLLRALQEFKNVDVENISISFQYIVLFLCWIPITNAVLAQRSFKLRAKI